MSVIGAAYRTNLPREHVVILGPKGAGKEALKIRIILDHFLQSYDPTLEDSYMKMIVVDREPCVIEIDLCGEEWMSYAMENKRLHYWDDAGIILLYSITSHKSFVKMQEMYKRTLELRVSSTQNDRTAQAEQEVGGLVVRKNLSKPISSIILVGTRSDLADERQVEYAQGRALAEEYGCVFCEVSSKDGSNVARLFEELVRVKRQERAFPERPESDAAATVKQHIGVHKVRGVRKLLRGLGGCCTI